MMNPGTAEANHLKAYIERIERVNEDIKGLQDDRKDIFAEAKGTGYSVPIIREIIKLRAMDADKRSEAQEMLDLYLSALGMAA